jgi:hypothetical protein
VKLASKHQDVSLKGRLHCEFEEGQNSLGEVWKNLDSIWTAVWENNVTVISQILIIDTD